ncbi:hypothetical protein QF041_000714 [Paenibacillus sp. W2I17]|nr:hypothetical protein [Paenibacillus sp. W2I17]
MIALTVRQCPSVSVSCAQLGRHVVHFLNKEHHGKNRESLG